MDHSKALAVLLVALLLGGCASVRWTFQRAFREPGEHLTAFPEEVWEEYDCTRQKRPFFVMEKNELTPQRVVSGKDFGHRMVYAMCPDRATAVVSGRLSTRIRFRGDPIVRDTIEDWEIKPGRWVVDAFVQIPEEAEPGVYAYEVAFEGDSLHFEKTLTFVVRDP